jgi:hypothetical protein
MRLVFRFVSVETTMRQTLPCLNQQCIHFNYVLLCKNYFTSHVNLSTVTDNMAESAFTSEGCVNRTYLYQIRLSSPGIPTRYHLQTEVVRTRLWESEHWIYCVVFHAFHVTHEIYRLQAFTFLVWNSWQMLNTLVRVFRPGRSQQNAQGVWTSPLTEIVGCVWVITGP